MVNYQLLISGKVQGVGLRWRIYQLAKQYQLVGIVQNLISGDVYCELQGSKSNVDTVIAAIKASPTPGAQVTKIHIAPKEISTYPQGFIIAR